MTDDLVKQLWESDEASALTNQAARRIEELEGKLTKAVKALAKIGKTYTADKNRLIHGDLRIIEMVQTTLAELKGEDRG
jgi:hypothetical protein